MLCYHQFAKEWTTSISQQQKRICKRLRWIFSSCIITIAFPSFWYVFCMFSNLRCLSWTPFFTIVNRLDTLSVYRLQNLNMVKDLEWHLTQLRNVFDEKWSDVGMVMCAWSKRVLQCCGFQYWGRDKNLSGRLPLTDFIAQRPRNVSSNTPNRSPGSNCSQSSVSLSAAAESRRVQCSDVSLCHFSY